VEDDVLETDETFTVTLDSVPTGNGTITAPNPSEGTILNDDYDVSFTPASVAVSAEEGNDLVFTLTLDRVAAANVTVSYTVAPVAPTIAADYTDVTGGSVTIASGSQTADITVNATEDGVKEVDEDFTVTLDSVDTGNGTITGANPATGTILNDDYDVSFTPASVAVSAEEGLDLVFTLTLDRVAAADVTVSYTVAPVAPTIAADYTDVTGGSVTIASGSQTADITVNATEDGVKEPDEDFTVTLDSVDTGNGTITGANPATGTILNDDYDVSFDSTAIVVAEDAGNAVFTVSLDRVITGAETVTVDYTTANGTADQPGDYTATNGTLAFDSGTGASLPISVPIIDDGIVELSEDFTVQLTVTSGNGTIPGSDTATGTITNNDAYTVSISNVSKLTVQEGLDANVTFTVTLANMDPVKGVVGMAQVDVATVDGTAVDGDDFTGGSNTLIFSGLTCGKR
jgi:hypothetical protein